MDITLTTGLSCDYEQVRSDISLPPDDPTSAVKTMAIEVLLPTMIAAHVKTVLTRRGIALDDFILDLLMRFVPGAASHLSEVDAPKPIPDREKQQLVETI